jgi:adenine-specific DNA-methyltransferase
MNKLKLHSPNLTEANIEKIAALFPSCIVEAKDENGELTQKVDFDQLRQELSDSIVEGSQERYRLDWPGKREALATANTQIAKTLRPLRNESVDFDTTQNVFVEGDNLDALKLLQETYLGKVKMIYIDPPYNTGNDFIYDDDFRETSTEYFERSNQVDGSGSALSANTESNGRFHSDWLSMMYARLKLSRNLLREDGVIFISIDDNEVSNLRKLCDEIFGESNFVSNIIWHKKYAKQNDSKTLSISHDHILLYAKSKGNWTPGRIDRDEDQLKGFKNPDNDKRGLWQSVVYTCNKTKSQRPNLYYPILNPITGKESWPNENRVWAYEKARTERNIAEGRLWWGKSGELDKPRMKSYLSEVGTGVVPSTLWSRTEVGDTQEAAREIRSIFESVVFDTPKPVKLLRRCMDVANCTDNDIILDFFAGSASTAHSVLMQNLENQGRLRYIMVQLDAECDLKSDAYKSGFKVITEISKERIRRAGKKIKEDNATTAANLDIGFRVLKIDTSNAKDIYYTPDAISQEELALQVDHIKEDRTAEDLLFQVMLDWGVDLALPISKEAIKEKDVYFVDENAIAACFDTKINEDFVKELAKREPLRVVFRDTCFESDSAKINVAEIFKLLSPNTEIKTI